MVARGRVVGGKGTTKKTGLKVPDLLVALSPLPFLPSAPRCSEALQCAGLPLPAHVPQGVPACAQPGELALGHHR